MTPVPRWRAALALALYRLLWALAWPGVWLRLAWRARAEPQYGRHWAQRCGFWPAVHPSPQPPGPVVWLHAVSLGETRAAAPLVDALRQRLPSVRFVFTSGTATGWAAAQDLMRPGDRHGWQPLDTPGATRRFVARSQAQLGLLMETEVWPEWLHQCRRAGLPVLLVNARLSARSARQAQRWPALMRPAAAALTQVLAQTPGDAQRLAQAGAREVSVVGNLKYDRQPDAAQLDRGRLWRQQAHQRGQGVVMAASWREGEDEALIEAWLALPEPRPRLWVVPRHPQRFDEVARAWQASGLRVWRRSQWTEASAPLPEAAWQAPVWLGDSLGEMALYAAASDRALLGGSFAPWGGQNLIELAAAGCGVVMGPHTFNFQDASDDAVAAGVARRCDHLRQAVIEASAGAQAAVGPGGDALREAARSWVAQHQGATQRTVEAIVRRLSA